MADGTGCIKTLGPTPATPINVKTIGTKTLIDTAASARGLVTMAFGTEDSKGLLVVLTGPSFEPVAEVALDAVPQSVVFTAQSGGKASFISVGYEGGGVEVWELPPKAATVDM
jgi:hypothetical protein